MAGAALAAGLAGCAGSNTTGGAGTGARPDSYAFWPPAPNEPRIQFLQTFNLSSDVEPEQSMFDRIVFGADAQVIPISKPYGIAMWKERIYVCDITNPAVVILDLEKRQTRLMLTRGVEQMIQPTDIVVAPDGAKYVADRRLGKVFMFDAEDRHVTTFGETDLAPAGLGVHGDELYVSDFQTQSILVLDRFRGTRKRSIGGPGDSDGGFIRPLGVCVDDEGMVYVSDAIRGRVQKFTPEGELELSIGQISDTPGNFVRPKHLGVDPDGIIYVVDAAFQNVQMFDGEGQLLMFFGGGGTFPGAMSLPAGLTIREGSLKRFEHLVHPAFQADRLVLVTNQFGGSKVSIYAQGKLKDGYTVDDIAPVRAILESGSPDETNPIIQGGTPAPDGAGTTTGDGA